jgi:hypothetical protein
MSGDHPHKADGTGTRHVSAFSPAVAAAPRGALVVWQDMRRGVGDIRIAHIVRSQPYDGPTRRIDGHGAAGNAWRPALAVSGTHAIVAWEDDRDGPSQVYVRRMPLPFIPSRP